MRPAAALALGLWIGAAVGAAVGWWYGRGAAAARAAAAPELTAQLQAKHEQVRLLEQEAARLAAETVRLRETVSELKSNLEARASAAAMPARRRTAALRSPVGAAEPVEPLPWIEEVVTGGDTNEIPRLLELAMLNDPFALEALALLAGHDGGRALMRAWNAPTLSEANRIRAVRLLGATLEVNPQAEPALRELFADPQADVRLLYAAVDGVANPRPPRLPVALLRQPGRSPPGFEPDFAERLRVLDTLSVGITDERLAAELERARERLLERLAEAAPAVP